MMLLARLVILTTCFPLALAGSVAAQPSTTIITHGFSAGSKGVWVQGMAEAILARAGGQGTCYRYDESTGLWNRVTTVNGNNTSNVLVLIFNWQPESAGVSAGPNWNYVQAAADALYGALRDAHYGNAIGSPPIDLVTGRKVHFIGHSRGTCVNSEAVRRLAWAGISVDQVTTHDPHPVNGTLDAPFNPNWGDPTPVKWNNVAWADNYWRADGGGIINGLNFDGITLADTFNTNLSDAVLNSGGYSQSHSDVHLWYHGTIDLSPTPSDAEQTITAAMRANWWNPDGYTQRGFYYSFLGGGSGVRPAGQPAGTAPTDPGIIYNGDFPSATYAGWTYHGGSGAGVIPSGTEYLRLRNGQSSRTHNRFYLPLNAGPLRFDYRVFTHSADDTLIVRLHDMDGEVYSLAAIGISSIHDWILQYSVELGSSIPRGRGYTLEFLLSSKDRQITAEVGIDNVDLYVELPPGLCGLIINGSFEVPRVCFYVDVSAGSSDIPGWHVGGASVDIHRTEHGDTPLGVAAHGEQVIDLDGTPGPGIISQSFYADIGQVYSLNFAFANNYVEKGSASASVRVFDSSGNLLGPLLLEHNSSVPCNLDWTVFSQSFVGTGRLTTLEFASQSQPGLIGGVMIDNVSISGSCVPRECAADIAPCAADGVVNIDDLVEIIVSWGVCQPCSNGCNADIVPDGGNGLVNIDDLVQVITNWGRCP